MQHRTSRSRTRHRRAHWQAAIPLLSTCPDCRQPTAPHRICPHCGRYRGRQVLPPAR